MPTTPTTPAIVSERTLASGNVAFVDETGRVLLILSRKDAEWNDGPTCSICDGSGHGYPGAGPCPLEDRGYWDDPRGD